EHVRLARRAGVNRARDEILARTALAGDQHGEVVALQPLDLIGDLLHRRARADEAREERLELPLDGPRGRFGLAFARLTQIEPLPDHRRERPKALENGRGPRPGADERDEPRSF